MQRWLIKSDPEEYSAADLERDGQTVWDGVGNALALKHLRAMKTGDEVLIYHTGDEKAVVALAEVASGARPDPVDKIGKLFVVDIKFVRRLPHAVPLDAIKADPTFAMFDLVRIGRLSIMPVSGAHWKRLMAMSETAASAP